MVELEAAHIIHPLVLPPMSVRMPSSSFKRPPDLPGMEADTGRDVYGAPDVAFYTSPGKKSVPAPPSPLKQAACLEEEAAGIAKQIADLQLKQNTLLEKAGKIKHDRKCSGASPASIGQ